MGFQEKQPLPEAQEADAIQLASRCGGAWVALQARAG
jgi:hypothetical protein